MKYYIYSIQETIVDIDLSKFDKKNHISETTIQDYGKQQAYLAAARPHDRISQTIIKTICLKEKLKPKILINGKG